MGINNKHIGYIQEYSGSPDLNMVCVPKKKRKSSIGWNNNAWYDVNMPLFVQAKRKEKPSYAPVTFPKKASKKRRY